MVTVERRGHAVPTEVGRLRRARGWSRRGFLATALAAQALAPARLLSAPAQFEYKLATTDPPDLATSVRLVQMAGAIQTETNGRLRIKVYPNSMLGSAQSMLAQLRIGAIQMLSVPHGIYTSVVPAAQIASVGFAFTSDAQPLALLDGALGVYLRREFAAKGMFVLEKTFGNGFRQITASSKAIRTAADVVGMRIRVMPVPIYLDMFTTLGASPTPLDASEVYTALQTHVVDACEQPLASTEIYKYYEVTKYLNLTNHAWGGSYVAANGDTWSALPTDIQEIVQRNQAKYALLERRDIEILNNSLTDKLRRQGMTVVATDTQVMRVRLARYYARWKNRVRRYRLGPPRREDREAGGLKLNRAFFVHRTVGCKKDREGSQIVGAARLERLVVFRAVYEMFDRVSPTARVVVGGVDS